MIFQFIYYILRYLGKQAKIQTQSRFKAYGTASAVFFGIISLRIPHGKSIQGLDLECNNDETELEDRTYIKIQSNGNMLASRSVDDIWVPKSIWEWKVCWKCVHNGSAGMHSHAGAWEREPRVIFFFSHAARR